MRSRISAAAFSVNVTATMRKGSTCRSSSSRYTSTSLRVFPVPALAQTTVFLSKVMHSDVSHKKHIRHKRFSSPSLVPYVLFVAYWLLPEQFLYRSSRGGVSRDIHSNRYSFDDPERSPAFLVGSIPDVHLC